MQNLKSRFFMRLYILLFVTFSMNLAMVHEIYAQESAKGSACDASLNQVQNKSFPLSNGSKQIVTYSVTNFKEHEECWKKMETLAADITQNSEIAGVYFFTLPPDGISEIDIMYKDFSQYGMNLIAEFWKDPDSGTKLVRYPNNANDGE